MKHRVFARSELIAGALVTCLAGCGGTTNAPMVPAVDSDAGSRHQRTFHYVDKVQPFKVPRGVTSITIVARGASGGGTTNTPGGRGGRVFAIVPVHPGEMLFVYVGGAGAKVTGGFNGGADGGDLNFGAGYGGGGASDVRLDGKKLIQRIVVAGGGGGGGGDNSRGFGTGGTGGGTTGGAGVGGETPSYLGGGGGGGGTQNAGGSGGAGGEGTFGSGDGGNDGILALGGAGGAGNYAVAGGGGGGGGYYGGGGGGGATYGTSEYGGGGGGGGGSAYAEPGVRSKSWRGWKNAVGNGLVVISW